MSKGLLKRGFKANAERIAIQYKQEMGIHPCAPLDAFDLAKHISVNVYCFSEFLDNPANFKLYFDNAVVSALTMQTAAGNRIIIHNSLHTSARQQSNIMHELAHIICDHQIANKDYGFKIPFGMREFDPVQEAEAKCLGSTLQLAKPCLLWARKRALKNGEVAKHFNASLEMVKYRMSITGISRYRPK